MWQTKALAAVLILRSEQQAREKMKPIDQLGFGPKREEKQLDDGRWEIKVTPPTFSGFSPSKITLTRDQFIGYNRWRVEGVLIQDALPDLSPAQREILISGIGPEEWDEAFGDDDKPAF